jgi:nitrogen-specific signal transduction histidine kinase/ActR/RegA family two-component response regulator
VETKAFPIKDDSGATISVIETLNNITEKHLLEEERLKTQKLESIGTLAGGIAHDFNNLLQGIFGYIAMAKLCLDEKDRALAMIEQAEKALQQSVSLTTQLLTFSRGGKPVREPLALGPVVENAVKFALSGSHNDYRLALDPGLWLVDADAGQLGQVIQNVAINADQAMPLGGCVEITARNVPPSDPDLPLGLERRNHVMLSVRDSGIGIPESDLDRIFDPYFTTKERGSGLGLATSYSIVRNHHGRIFARSKTGEGSTIFIFLPATEAVARTPQHPATTAGARAARILVMDDEAIVRDIAVQLLSFLGHTVAAADRGEAAIVAFQAARDAGCPFDVVILDLTVRGGMGGAPTVARLREIDPDVRAVASSGYSDDAALSDHRAQGFAAFLKKPYTLKQLQDVLNTVVG